LLLQAYSLSLSVYPWDSWAFSSTTGYLYTDPKSVVYRSKVVYPDPCDEDEERIDDKCESKCHESEKRINGKCEYVICEWYYDCPYPYEPEPVVCEEGFVDSGNGCEPGYEPEPVVCEEGFADSGNGCEPEYPICPDVAGDTDCDGVPDEPVATGEIDCELQPELCEEEELPEEEELTETTEIEEVEEEPEESRGRTRRGQ
jgi:hypothetical protein